MEHDRWKLIDAPAGGPPATAVLAELSLRLSVTEGSSDDDQVLPPGLTDETVAVVREARRFEHGMLTARAARRAAVDLLLRAPQPAQPADIGLVLVSARGDQHMLVRRRTASATHLQAGERAPTDVFRSLAYFPVGRVAKSVGDAAGLQGPVASTPHLADGRLVAETWLLTGRARQVVVLEADAVRPGETAEAKAELWTSQVEPVDRDVMQLVTTDQRWADGDDWTCAELARSVVEAQLTHTRGRVLIVVNSMLAEAGETVLSSVSGDPIPVQLSETIAEVAQTHGVAGTILLVGSPGGDMTALALAQDLLTLDRADNVVVCGIDLVTGPLAAGLTLLRCDDRPHFVGGAAALTLARPLTGSPVGRTIDVPWLASPTVPGDPSGHLDLEVRPPASSSLRQSAANLAVTGLTQREVQHAADLADRTLPGVPVTSDASTRSVGADVLRLVCEYDKSDEPLAVFSVHALGGTGVCTSMPGD